MTFLETLMPLDAIPFFVDERLGTVCYVGPFRLAGRLGFDVATQYPNGYLVGSTQAWGAYYAHNLAEAYWPEGVPRWR